MIAACERLTWHPNNPRGRNWVCSPQDGEELCEWCRDEEWRLYQEILVSNHRLRLESEARDNALYGSIVDRPGSIALVATYGSPEAAIAAIVENADGQGELAEELPTLLAWRMTRIEALRSWHELLTKAQMPGVPKLGRAP